MAGVRDELAPYEGHLRVDGAVRVEFVGERRAELTEPFLPSVGARQCCTEPVGRGTPQVLDADDRPGQLRDCAVEDGVRREW